MKGKAIKVPPVPGVATAQLKTLLDAVLPKAGEVAEVERQEGGRGVMQTLQEVESLMAVRRALLPALVRGNQGCGERLRDVLYLDLALDGAVRSSVEASLSLLKAASSSEDPETQAGCLLDLVALCVESVCLTSGSNVEMVMILRDFQASQALASPMKWLRAQAASERLTRELGALSERYLAALQPTATALGDALSLSPESTGIFAEEVVRGSSAAPLAQVVSVLAPTLRQMAGLSSWDVISPASGLAVGRLVVVQALSQVQDMHFQEPTVLLVQHIGGEEDIPEGVVGVLSAVAPDVLCHAAVRARNSSVLLVACSDAEETAAIAGWQDQQVQLQLTQGNTAVEVSPAQGRPDASASASSGDNVASNSGRDLPQMRQREWCGQYAISSIAFDDNTVGAKSLNTLKLRGQLPVWVNLPCSAALPFGAFEAVLQQPQNADPAAAVQKLDGQQRPSPDQLQAVKAALQALQPDAQLQDQVKAAFQQSGLQWDGSNPSWQEMWRATTAVWASKWNVRAVSSMRKAGLQHRHLQMAVLCQPFIPAQYAFVAHTTNPITGNEGEIYIELVQGFGEALVGNFPGSALRAVVSKEALLSSAQDVCSSQSLEEAMSHLPDHAVRVCAYPSKSVALKLPDLVIAAGGATSHVIIFRSDSNGEDLEGYAGAGLFDSVQSMEPMQMVADYSRDLMCYDLHFQRKLLAAIGVVSLRLEQLVGSAQDIEGVIDNHNAVHVVQTRPQV
ncbi:COP9 signalosome complex subunit 8 [Trebouxia sp. C0009 RCD-2024]